MILVDANILLYAEDRLSPHHEPAREWWDRQLSGADPVCLCWLVLTAFIRIGTNHRVFKKPLSLEVARTRINSWFTQPCVQLVGPTEQHWKIFQKLLIQGKASGNLVTDAHLATLAIENGGTLYSTDADFSRFVGLKWKRPF